MGAAQANHSQNGRVPARNGHADCAAPWLRAVVAARLGEAQAVEEVLQEIALQSARQTGGSFSNRPGWLYRVAVRQCLLYRRKHGRQRRLIQRYAAMRTNQVVAPDPLGWLLADERLTLVRQAIARLSARDAEILLLKYAHEHSYAQIAGHLGITISAVETRLFRARERMRQELTAVGPEAGLRSSS